MEKRILTKPDGRKLILYSRRPIPDGIRAPSPRREPVALSGHFRFNPLRNEWVVYADHRQNRTFLPPAEYNPLAASDDASNPTEVPAGDYDICVFENMFPSLAPTRVEPAAMYTPAKPSSGSAEVVVYTQDALSSLGLLPLSRIETLLEVWADRTRELGARDDVNYVFIFENRGVEVGATLHHPHGQIYAYPFVPPVAAAELAAQAAHAKEHPKGLLENVIENEIREAARIVYLGRSAIAFLPAFARYAYEVWIAPLRPKPTFADLDRDEREDLARALKTVLLKFDKLWDAPFPYVMVWHQAPTDGQAHPEAHLHAEFYPPYRMRGRLKYLAGSELGAGVFTSDTLPEERARELRDVTVEF